MSEHNAEKPKHAIKEYEPIAKYLLDYRSKIIPDYIKKIVLSKYGIFNLLIITLLQLEIAIGFEDGRYYDQIPELTKNLQKYMRKLLVLIEQKKLGYIA